MIYQVPHVFFRHFEGLPTSLRKSLSGESVAVIDRVIAFNESYSVVQGGGGLLRVGDDDDDDDDDDLDDLYVSTINDLYITCMDSV